MPLRVRVWGHFPTLPFLAVVGSRRPTQTAVSSVPWIVDAAVSSGWALLSGGARGVDGEVHRECLRRGGVAVVLGSGLDRPYPRSTQTCFEGSLHWSQNQKMLVGLGDSPAKCLIAFSNAVMVVRRLRSDGQSQDVHCVGGARTPHRSLLRDGALLVAEPEDLVAALALLQPSAEADAKQDQEDARSRQKEG